MTPPPARSSYSTASTPGSTPLATPRPPAPRPSSSTTCAPRCVFLLGHTELRKELDHISVTADGDGFRIAGIPHGMQNRLKSLTLRVTPAGQITAMRVEEVDGAATQFDFDHSEENVPAKDSDFVFTAPAGVGVIDAMPPI